MKKLFSNTLINNIIYDYNVNQLSIAKLSKLYNISTYYITNILKENNIKIVNRQNIVNFSIEQIINLYKQGYSITQISKIVKNKRDTISKYLKRNNINIINYHNKSKFNEHIFDVIDTEEKAY